jgi:ubiquinone/menaquinone biosynthesis C-methylase UbiE
MKVIETVDWSLYASQYDTVMEFNPAYQELMQEVSRVFNQYSLPVDGAILDLGAGTGNFAKLLFEQLPGRDIILVDNNETMTDIASEKIVDSQGRLKIFDCDADQITDYLRHHKIAATLMVNSLYSMGIKAEPERPKNILRNVYQLLEPGGLFVIIDCGRLMKTFDWAMYTLKNVYKRTRSFREVIRLLSNNTEVVRQNRNVALAQKTGEYYMHDLAELEQVILSVGFKIQETSDKLYRGFDDFVVARKPE